MFFLASAYYYLGSFRFISIIGYFISATKVLNKPINYVQLLVIFYLLFILIFNTFRLDISSSLLFLRLFWGVFLFYTFFKNRNYNLNRITIFLSLITIIEYILIQSNPSIVYTLPNYDDPDLYSKFYSTMGLLSGAYSFGGNRTVSGVLLLILHINSIKNEYHKAKILSMIAFILCISTTAYFLYFIYLFFNSKGLLKKIFFILLIVFFFINISQITILERFSFNYLLYLLFEFKLNQIYEAIELLNVNNMTFIFGNLEVTSKQDDLGNFGLYFGDFLLLDFITIFGTLGIVVFLYFYFYNLNKNNRMICLLLLLSTAHYHVIFSLPGQILTGYFLSRKNT